MTNQIRICDNRKVVNDTPLTYISSIPAWLTGREVGLHGLCKGGLNNRKYAFLDKRQRFSNPFEKLSENNKWGYPRLNHRNRYHRPFIVNSGNIKSCKSLISHLGCVNALAFSQSGSGTLISGGDDRRILVWKCPQFEDVDKVRPIALSGEHDSNIFCLEFNGINETKIFSGGNDERVLVHDTHAGGRTQDIFLHEAAVYGIDGHPFNGNIFVSACADGRVQMFDLRQSPKENIDPLLVAVATRPFRPFLGVQFNPCEPRLLVTANQKEGARLWDVRKPRRSVLEYGSVELGKYNGSRWHGDASERCMTVRFNKSGTRVAALGRRMPPVVYELSSPKPFAEFDSPGYYNSCTMKSVCFGGLNDDYILAGSDDFNLYAWKIPEIVNTETEETQLVNRASTVLRGHRSIVNQVRYNSPDGTIATAGVEKCIRLWSPFQVPGREQIAGRNDPEKSDEYTGNITGESETGLEDRSVSSRENYLRLVQESHSILSHDYSNETTEENPRMLAFFDRLVQREMEDNRFSSSGSSSDGDGPGGTYRPISPASISSITSHVSNLTESENELQGEAIESTGTRIEPPIVNVDNIMSANNFGNVTGVGRFIANQPQSILNDTDLASNDNIEVDNTSNNGDEDVVTSTNSNIETDETGIEVESITISNLISKKRRLLELYRMKKIKKSRKLESKGSRARAANILEYHTFRYEQKLRRARKIVSLDDSSSSSSESSSETDSSEEEKPSSTEEANPILSSSYNSNGSIAVCDNLSDNKSGKRDDCPLTIPNSFVKNDSKMRLSILRALEEYETEQEDSSNAQLSEKKTGCYSKKDFGKGQESTNLNDKSPETSPDKVSLKITCNRDNNTNVETDKEVFPHNSLTENNSDNVIHLQNNRITRVSKDVENKLSTISTGCDNIVSTSSSSNRSENLKKVPFKKGGGAVKGKRSYRKREHSDD